MLGIVETIAHLATTDRPDVTPVPAGTAGHHGEFDPDTLDNEVGRIATSALPPQEKAA